MTRSPHSPRARTWRAAKFAPLGIDHFADLSAADLHLLCGNIQKCHVIGHNLGAADGHYVKLTQTEQLGESAGLIGDETRRFGETRLRVGNALETELPPPGHVSLRPGEAP